METVVIGNKSIDKYILAVHYFLEKDGEVMLSALTTKFEMFEKLLKIFEKMGASIGELKFKRKIIHSRNRKLVQCEIKKTPIYVFK